MLVYLYTAQNNETGDTVKAEVQAESEIAAAKVLIAQGLFPITIEPKEKTGLLSSNKLNQRIGTKDRVIFTRQLSTLINAGLPLTQALRTIQDQISNKALQAIVAQIVSSVEGGMSLSQAFAQFPKVFSKIYVSLVAAGESSGSLDTALERIANQQEKDAAIASKIRGAMIYPLIVLGVIFAVIIFMLTTVLPQISQLYVDLHANLPISTRILIAVSKFLINFWWLVIFALVGLVFATRAWIQTDSGRSTIDRFKLKIPIFGKIFQKVYMARFCRTLGTMLSSGIPMLEGLSIVKDSIGNVHVAKVIDHSMAEVRGGKALSGTLENNEEFTKLVPQMIKIGEQSGTIDAMLDRVAIYYESEVDEEVKNLSTTIEPIMMVIMGVLVGGVIAAILLPVYGLVGSGGVNNMK